MLLIAPHVRHVARSQGPALACSGQRLLSTVAVPLDESFPGVTLKSPLGPAKPVVVKDVAGITVAAQETFAPLATMCLLIGAGSHSETSENTGVAAIARRLAFKSTAMHSQLAIAREFERMGSELVAIGSRETTLVFVQSHRDLARMVGQLAEELGGRLTPTWWEVDQCRKELAYEIDAATSDPVHLAIDALHQAAFRGPLSRPVLPSKEHVGHVSYNEVLAFLDAHYNKANAVLTATGVSDEFFGLVQEAFGSLPQGTKPQKPSSTYKGGRDVRIDQLSPTTTVAVGFEGPCLDSNDLVAAAVLQHALGTGPVAKWGSLGGRLGTGVQSSIKGPVKISSFGVSYSSSGLLGVLAQAAHNDIGSLLGVVKDTLASVADKGLTDEEVAKAKAQLKTALLVANEQPHTQVEDMAQQVYSTGKVASVAEVVDGLDKLTTAHINKTAKTILNSKACMAAVGNMASTPYLDQVVA